jgi:adenosylhomocysteine nucleosidase
VFAIDIKPAAEGDRSSHMHVGRVLTTNRVIDTPEEKRALGSEHRALAVDMESFAVATICQREKTRFLSVRVITDSVNRTLPPDIDHLVKRTSTAGRLGAAAGAILRRPASIKDMWQLKEDAIVASERLANFLTGVIRQLP